MQATTSYSAVLLFLVSKCAHSISLLSHRACIITSGSFQHTRSLLQLAEYNLNAVRQRQAHLALKWNGSQVKNPLFHYVMFVTAAYLSLFLRYLTSGGENQLRVPALPDVHS